VLIVGLGAEPNVDDIDDRTPRVVRASCVMSPLAIATIVFVCVFGGALAGMFVRAVLPEHHLSTETENVVKLGTGMIATLVALVVGLLIASAKSAFDIRATELKQFASTVILLNRQLVHYGPEAREPRDFLRQYTVYAIDYTWPDEAAHPSTDPNGWMLLEEVQDRLRALAPGTDAQRWLHARALQLSGDLAQTRWLFRVQAGSSIPTAFLIILAFWLSIIFTSFGLFAPRNGTALTALFVCAVSVAGAVFLILEMTHPFGGGLIRISSAPMHEALAYLNQ
jgi:hypothetical protein